MYIKIYILVNTRVFCVHRGKRGISMLIRFCIFHRVYIHFLSYFFTSTHTKSIVHINTCSRCLSLSVSLYLSLSLYTKNHSHYTVLLLIMPIHLKRTTVFVVYSCSDSSNNTNKQQRDESKDFFCVLFSFNFQLDGCVFSLHVLYPSFLFMISLIYVTLPLFNANFIACQRDAACCRCCVMSVQCMYIFLLC